MPKKKAIDSKKLLKMIKDETPRPEIMKEFGFKTTAQLNTAYVNAMVDEGIAPEIKSGRRGAAKKDAPKEAKVGKSGSIIVPKGLVEEMGFVQNDRFLVRKTKTGISLKKLYK